MFTLRRASLFIPFAKHLTEVFTKTTKTAQFEAQNAFYSFAATHGKNPIWTGRTMRETKVYITRRSFFLFPNLPSLNVKYRFITMNTKNYAQFPFFGLGTSRKYGPRKWLGVSAKRTANAFIENIQKKFA
jgi:hypothetical protein